MSLSIPAEDVAIANGLETDMVNSIDRYFPHLKAHHFVCEAGAGTGKLGISMASRFGCHVTLVDNDAHALLTENRLKWAVEGLQGRDIPVWVKQADIRNLPYLDDTFHLAFNEGVAEHFRPPSLIVKEMLRVSKDAVAVIVPNAKNAKQVYLAKDQTAKYHDRPEHWASYEKPMTVEEMKAMLSDELGLDDVHVELIWLERPEGETRTMEVRESDYRMVFGFGRKHR